ncbi:MAG: serine/threonine protein kinase [Alphaproteobacteria bacterium]|nr:serine/threonine protein kinase [Alphaproteobacteria bacterium]MCB9698349.1 serine/threonine protein kinase [Alphaproteobacteria bacterium]
MPQTHPDRLPPPPATPRAIANGRYILVRKLAEGGTAIVHLGYDTETGQWRAVKTLLAEYSKRPALRHRFEIEGRTMAELEHPNIIRVYDAGQDGDTAWLVMEFAEGGSVIDWVEQHGRMPPRMACELCIGLCDGIQFAHERGIIHRDIKPQNVLVDAAGTCKVTDFGIAQVVQETRMTMTGTVMGTIGYMAPEQHESAKHADQRADVYSIAATLYTLLAGEAPTHLFMADDSDFETLPSALAEVIRKGAQYRREVRYETVAEMGDALRRALPGLPPDPADTPALVSEGGVRLDQLTPPTASTVDPGYDRRHAELAPSNAAPIVTVPPPVQRSEEPKSNHLVPSDGSSALARRSLTNDTVPRLIDRTPHATTREAQERQERRRRVGAVLAIALAVVIALGGAIVGVGALRIGQWQKLEETAQEHVYVQIHEERTLLDVLRPLDVPQFDELQQLFDQVDHGQPEEREAAVGRLMTTLDKVRRRLESRGSTREEHAVKQVTESQRRLQERIAEQQRLERQVAGIRDSFSGRAASTFGF